MGERVEGDDESTLVNDSSYVEDETPLKTNFVKRNAINEKNTDILIKSMRDVETRLDKKLRELCKQELVLKKAFGIISRYEAETKTLELIAKWKGVCQCGMAYMLNAVKLKIDKMGGYQEFKRKEIESKKRRIEYNYDDSLQEQITDVLESPDYFHLPEEEKNEIKARIDERVEEIESCKRREIQDLEREIENAAVNEFTMVELAAMLKVDHSLVFS